MGRRWGICKPDASENRNGSNNIPNEITHVNTVVAENSPLSNVNNRLHGIVDASPISRDDTIIFESRHGLMEIPHLTNPSSKETQIESIPMTSLELYKVCDHTMDSDLSVGQDAQSYRESNSTSVEIETNSCIHARSHHVESVISTQEKRMIWDSKCNTVQQEQNSEGKINLKIYLATRPGNSKLLMSINLKRSQYCLYFLGKSKENCTEEPSMYSEQVNPADAMLHHDSNVLDGQPSLEITESSKNVEC